jgi:ElaB/YqjD/DUF883 family membrane-anchored ribosome-binding protein
LSSALMASWMIARILLGFATLPGGTMNERPGEKSGSGNVADQARTVADRAADRATDAIASAKASLHETVDAVADRATAASQWASRRVGAATQAPTDLIEAGADYIRERPYVAVGAALAVGYLIGKLR